MLYFFVHCGPLRIVKCGTPSSSLLTSVDRNAHASHHPRSALTLPTKILCGRYCSSGTSSSIFTLWMGMRSSRCASAPSSCWRSLNVGVAELDWISRSCCLAPLSREGSASAGLPSSDPKHFVNQYASAIRSKAYGYVKPSLRSYIPDLMYCWREYSQKPVEWELGSQFAFARVCLRLHVLICSPSRVCGVNKQGR